MIEIDEKALEGKVINQFDENNKQASVWVDVNGFRSYENSKLNGWLFYNGYGCWFEFCQNNNCIIETLINVTINKITRKEIII